MSYSKKNDDEYILLHDEIKRRLTEKNTDIFRVVNRIENITKILSEGSEGNIFLSRKDFKKIYPALLSPEFRRSKVNVIVEAGVLLDEKKGVQNPYTFFLNDRFIQIEQEKAPSLACIPDQSRVFVADAGVQCDSFMIFNNRSYILKIENIEDPYFSCSLNAPYKKDQEKRLELLSKVMSKIKTLSVPFQEIERKVSNQKRHNRLDNGYERE